jgi:hypothetical protein
LTAAYAPIIKKPFRVSELATKVAEALAAGDILMASNVLPMRSGPRP